MICKKNIIVFLIFAFLLINSGCEEGVINSDEVSKSLQESYIGNSLQLVELDTLIAANKLVPKSTSKAYVVEKRVGIEGSFYVFNVYTPHGTYTVKGVAGLVEYCADAEIIEMFLGSNYGEELTANMMQGLVFDNAEVVDVKAHKIDSIRGVGRRFNEIYREDVNVTEIVENVSNRDNVHNSFYDQTKMKLAQKLGLDGYSANLFVQKFIGSLLLVPDSYLEGLNGVDLVYPGINRKNIDASFQSNALSAGGRSMILERKLIDNAPSDLRANLLTQYKKLFKNIDLADAPINELVYSPYYSSREELYIFAYLNDMKKTAGRKSIIALLADAHNAFTAKEYFLQLQLMHAYYVAGGGLRQLVALSNMVGGLDNSGQIIVMPIWDHTRDRIAVRKLLVEVNNFRKKLNAVAANIWFVGDCDKNTIATAAKIGITVRKDIALDPIFRFTNYRRLTYKFERGDPLIRNAVALTPNVIAYYERTNRPVPTPLLPEDQNIAKMIGKKKSSIVIEEPVKPKSKKHDPRNLREFGIGVKIIPKEELDGEGGVPTLAQEGVVQNFDSDETGSSTGSLPPMGVDPVQKKVSSEF